MRRFECPRCKKHNIREVSTGGIRVSNVVVVDTIDPTKFICSQPEFHHFDQKGNTHYECSDCARYLGRSVTHIIGNYFVDTKVPSSVYGENACREIFLEPGGNESTLEEPEPEGINLSDPVEPKGNESDPMEPTETAYRIKLLKKCEGDSPSVRETIDMINFIIAAGNSKVEVEHDRSQRTEALSKVIKERPHLFERVCG